jgi:hypothetical protein
MQAPEVIWRDIRQPDWFRESTKRQQRVITDELMGVIGEVSDQLAPDLPFPAAIEVGIIEATDSTFAEAGLGTIEFSQRSLELIGQRDVLRGLAGHELSHIADEEGDNDCSTSGKMLQTVIAEGKAEAVGIHIGGEAYYNEFCAQVPPELRADLYWRLLRRPNVSAKQVESFGGSYRVGLTLVHDVMRIVERPVLEIHAEPVAFYTSAIQRLQQRKRESYEATA